MKWFRRKEKQPIKPSIEAQQTEKLAQLGAQLSLWRQEKNLSLEELVGLTRISRRILQAIEEGNLADLPEPVYIQGLIKQFADALGVNGVDFASDFPIGSPKVNLPQNAWKNTFVGQLRPVHLYILYISLIFCSVNSLSNLLNKAALQANNSQNQLQSPKESPLTSQQLTSNNLQAFKSVEQAVQIGVILKSSSWIRVVVDGKTDFEGVLPQGTYRTWKAQEQLTVKTNNAGGVLMSVNQQAPKQMGEPGKIEEVRIAAKPRF